MSALGRKRTLTFPSSGRHTIGERSAAAQVLSPAAGTGLTGGKSRSPLLLES
jgi:hypothetical protein